MRLDPSTARDIRNGALIGAVALLLAWPLTRYVMGAGNPVEPPTALLASALLPAQPSTPLEPSFGDTPVSDQTRELALWIARSGDHAAMPFVLIDKQAATLMVFDADARLLDSTPVLLGSARGDDSVPGIGQRPVEQVRPQERTTPAGRFVGQFGHSLTGEDVVWVDYDAAVSMHRVRPTLQPRERRAQRLASATIEDNRISYGCINVPAAFYEQHIKPVYSAMPARVYVLPEHKSLREVFGPMT